jgi:hypothetical protein
MRTKIAVFLSLLFLLSGAVLQDAIQDAIEARADLDLGAEEDASPIQDPDIFLKSSQLGALQNRKTRRKLWHNLLRDFDVRLTDFLSAGRTKESSLFVQLAPMELYKLQHAFRI